MPVMPIPDDWDGQDWACYAIEWPNSPLFATILLGQLSELARGRYWDERSGTVTDAQEIGRQIYLRNELDREVLLTCSEEALAILQQIADKACCGGSVGGGIGCEPGSGGAGFGEAPPLDDGVDFWNEPGDPPDGFDTWADYEAYKCALAQQLYDNAILDINWMITWSSIASGVAAMASRFITPVPGGTIAALGVLFGSVTLSVFVQIMTDLKTALQNKEDDLVCALFSQITATGASNAWKAVADPSIATEMTLPGTSIIATSVSDGLMSSDNVNSLFFKDEAYSDITPSAAPCASCVPPCLNVLLAPPVIADGFTITINPSNWTLTDPSSGGLAWASNPAIADTSTLKFEPALSRPGDDIVTLELYQTISPGLAYNLQWRFFDGLDQPIGAWSSIEPPWLEEKTIVINAPGTPWAYILFRSDRQSGTPDNSELVFLEVEITCPL